MEIPTLRSDEVRELADRAVQRGSVVAFQSTLAAATQAVRQALQCEQVVSAAALSLAHSGALGDMTVELRAAQEALESALNRQGQCLISAGEPRPRRTLRIAPRAAQRRRSRPTWQGALSGAISVLDRGASSLEALASGQPTDAPSRRLGIATAILLRAHCDRLKVEAERLSELPLPPMRAAV